MIKKLNKISRAFEQRLVSNNIRGYAVTLELEKLHETLTTEARFAVGDINTGVISFQLKLNNEPVVLDSETLVYANVETPEQDYLYQTCEVLDAELGIVILRLKTQAMSKSGQHRLELVVQPSEDEKLITPMITYDVYETLDSNLTEPAEDEINLVTSLISEVSGTNVTIQANEEIRQHNENVRIANEVLRQQKLQETMDIYYGQIVVSTAEIDTIIANALK